MERTERNGTERAERARHFSARSLPIKRNGTETERFFLRLLYMYTYTCVELSDAESEILYGLPAYDTCGAEIQVAC